MQKPAEQDCILKLHNIAFGQIKTSWDSRGTNDAIHKTRRPRPLSEPHGESRASTTTTKKSKSKKRNLE